MRTKAPQFKFARHVRRSKLNRDSDALLEAIVKAIRDKKSRHYLRALVRVYPAIKNGANPYRILIDEVFKYRDALDVARRAMTEDQNHNFDVLLGR